MTRPCLTLALLAPLLSLVVTGNRNGITLASRSSIRVTNSRSPLESNMIRPRQFSNHNTVLSADINNDSDHRVIVGGHDNVMLKAVEASLLNLFGLPYRPRPSKRVHIPHYMLDLYNQHVSGGRRPPTTTNGGGVFNANTIRSFYQNGKCLSFLYRVN